MTARFCCIAAVLLVTSMTHAARSEETAASSVRKADEIIQKHIDAIGGAAKIKALKSLRARGRVEQNGLELPFTLWRKRPDKSRVEVGFKGMFLTLGHDGKRSWWVNPLSGVLQPAEVPKDYAELVLRWSDFEGPLVDYRRKGHRAEYEGEQRSDAGVLHRIKLTLSNGDVWRVFIDAKTYVEVKRIYPQSYGGRTRETATRFREYALVDGVRLYRVIEGEALDRTPFTMTLLSYEANVPVEDAHFEKP
jgi:hypothetical protein